MKSEPKSPRVNNAAASSPRRWRDLVLLVGLFILVIIGLIGLALATGWEETIEAIASLNLTELVILLALSLVNYVFRGLRWHLFALKLGLGTSLIQNMRHFLAGFAMSVTPGRVGELVRMRWLRRETGWSFERTAPLVLVDRAADLAAMAILLALAVALSATGMKGGAPVACSRSCRGLCRNTPATAQRSRRHWACFNGAQIPTHVCTCAPCGVVTARVHGPNNSYFGWLSWRIGLDGRGLCVLSLA